MSGSMLFVFGSVLLILGFCLCKTAEKCPDDIFSFRKPKDGLFGNDASCLHCFNTETLESSYMQTTTNNILPDISDVSIHLIKK